MAPRFGSIWIPFTQANRSIFVKDDKKDRDIVRRMASTTENTLIGEIKRNIQQELTRTVSLSSEGGAEDAEDDWPAAAAAAGARGRAASGGAYLEPDRSIDSLLEELERESRDISLRNASRSFQAERMYTSVPVGGAGAGGPPSPRARGAGRGPTAASFKRRGMHAYADFPVFSSAEIQYITHWMMSHRDWLGLDLNAEILRGNVVRNGCFPLHNEGMRIRLKDLLLTSSPFWPIFNFSSENHMSNMNLLEDIRFYMGDDAAWFYAFADFLAQTFLHLVFYGCLCLLLIVAVGDHVAQIQYTIYALIMSVSVQVSIKRWKRLRAKLRLRWGVGDSLIFFSDSDENIKYKTRFTDKSEIAFGPSVGPPPRRACLINPRGPGRPIAMA